MVQLPVQTLSALFCAMCYVKDGRYSTEDETSEHEKMCKKRKSQVEFDHIKSTSSAISLRSYKLPAIRSLRNQKNGEEHFPN